MSSFIKIGKKTIGENQPVFIIAELSANHHQNFEEAEALIRAAHEAGADAVKLQTYTPDTITIKSNAKYFRIGNGTIWKGKNLYDLYAEAYTPWEWQPELKKIANAFGMELFSTPFDPTSITFLESMDIPAYKIASFEIVDIPLMQAVARHNKPVIISTGMATLEEIAEAVAAVRDEGNDQVALLKCTSAYPALPKDMNLRTIPDLAVRFDLPVGLSDHTLGIAVPVASVALGACIIEKHFTLSRNVQSPDSSFSLEPGEFRAMVSAVREAEQALGTINYEVTEHEQASRFFRRSLFAVEDIPAGAILDEKNVRSIRPGNGLAPKYINEIIGKRAKRLIRRGTPLKWNLFE